jgi:hypothetical protein
MMLPIIVAACGDPDPGNTSEASLEHKLAILHNGGNVSADDPMVSSFTRALDHLEAKCPESRQQLADMGVRGRELLSNSGLDEPLLAVFENWRAAIPNETEDGGLGRCADILALYVTLRGGR